MCEQCMKTKEIIANARFACQIAGRLDMDRVLFDIEEQIFDARYNEIFDTTRR